MTLPLNGIAQRDGARGAVFDSIARLQARAIDGWHALIEAPAWRGVAFRRLLAAAVNVSAIALASYLAISLRFDGAIPTREWRLFLSALPWVVAVQGSLFIAFGLHRGYWRYTGLWELARIFAAVAAGSALLYLLIYRWFGWSAYPRSVLFIDSMLLIVLAGGVRVAVRMVRELRPAPAGKRILIYGAGDAGEMIVRDLRKHRYDPVGLLDDDSRKHGREIHGVPVLGARDALPRVVSEKRPHEVLVAIPSAGPAVIRDIVRALEPYRLTITTLPRLPDLRDGVVGVHQMRKLAFEDLLHRAPVGLDAMPVRHLIEGRPVMVTGAGGSIGSELCRQIAKLRPSVLLLYERYENGLYAVGNDLDDLGFAKCRRLVVGDIGDRARLQQVMLRHHPEVIFHAAAHKHVPLMELNPCEAVKNNVIGTKTVAEVAMQAGVKRFVLISTDKAVNPTSMMGATKRAAELILLSLAPQAPTHFVTVRFGNVLGSNGSVLPRWLDQIRSGGPVTVTHPEIRRYFMLIPEAVQLLLHAAAVADAGGVFVLDMGPQVPLAEMARNLIRLSGFVPDRDIAIAFTQLRPGEKLFEELVGTGEFVEPAIDRIMRVHPRQDVDPVRVLDHIGELSQAAVRGDTAGATALLQHIVPTFRPDAPPNDIDLPPLRKPNAPADPVRPSAAGPRQTARAVEQVGA